MYIVLNHLNELPWAHGAKAVMPRVLCSLNHWAKMLHYEIDSDRDRLWSDVKEESGDTAMLSLFVWLQFMTESYSVGEGQEK